MIFRFKKDHELTAFEVLDTISSIYECKQVYFQESDGSVYSRRSCKNMTLNEAVREFAGLMEMEFGDLE